MKIIFFSSDLTTVDKWKSVYNLTDTVLCHDIQTVNEATKKYDDYILLSDYDSVATELNKIISSGTELKNIIVLEKAPEIATGKKLISHNIKAYGNSQMLPIHFNQMLETVKNGKVWSYPELTVSLVKKTNTQTLSKDSTNLINNRLSPKEIEVIYLILEGLTNDAISSKLDITTRTVKAHVSSIFSKLHVNDRISLILLLK